MFGKHLRKDDESLDLKKHSNARHFGHGSPGQNRAPNRASRDEVSGTSSRGPNSHARPDTSRDLLYLEFTLLVKRLVRQYGKTAEQRQDLEGEIYWQFCGHVEAYDPERGVPLRPYIVRLLSASVYTYARKQWKLEERETALNQTEGDYHPALMLDPTPQWVHNVSQQQIIAALPMSLTQLPERQRKVVIMRYYEQRSFEEIAELLAIKPATARSLLRHGLCSLRKHISPLEVEEAC